MYPPCFVMPIFGIRVGVHHYVGSFCIPAASLSGEKERQGFQMRKFKTAADNRTNYIYYFDDGSKCVITPGEDGENTTIIAQRCISVNRNLPGSCDFSRLYRNCSIILSLIPSCNPLLFIVSCRYRKGVSPMIM